MSEVVNEFPKGLDFGGLEEGTDPRPNPPRAPKLRSELAEGTSSSISSSSDEGLLGPTSFPVEVTTADSADTGTTLGAETGIEGKLPLVAGIDEGLPSVIGTLELVLAETVVPVTSDVTTSGLDTILFKPVDDSLTGIGIDSRELDMVPSGNGDEGFVIDSFDGRMEGPVGDKTSDVFAADSCIVDEDDVAEEGTVGLIEHGEDCATGVGGNAGGWNATSGLAFTGLCTVSVILPSCTVFPCNRADLGGSGDKDGLLRSLNAPPIFCGETSSPFVVPKYGIACPPCLFFVIMDDAPPESPDKVFTVNGLRENFEPVIKGDKSGSVLVLVFGMTVVLNVKVLDFGMV